MKAKPPTKDEKSSTLKQRMALALQESPYEGGSELARAIGITAASVSDWLTGKTKSMKSETATKAARVLQVNALWLSTGEGPMRPNGHAGANPGAVSLPVIQERAALSPKMVAETYMSLRDHYGEMFDMATEEGAAEFIFWYTYREGLPEGMDLGKVIELDSLRAKARGTGVLSDRHGGSASSHGAHGRKR